MKVALNTINHEFNVQPISVVIFLYQENVDKCIKQQKAIQEQLKATSEEVHLLRPKYDELKKTVADKKKLSRNAGVSCHITIDMIFEKFSRIRMI